MLMNNEFVDVILKENRRMSTSEWREYMYDELRVSFLATELHLPMRTVHGILRADNGYVIYDIKPGCEFPRFLDENDEKLDFGTRIKLCRALSSVMAGLFNAFDISIVVLSSWRISMSIMWMPCHTVESNWSSLREPI
ncbi:hypothetical protein COOONC_06205 [Cooperia oncophora]